MHSFVTNVTNVTNTANAEDRELKMFCPLCKMPLIKGKMLPIETLAEHVFDPDNAKIPEKQTYVCSDPRCIATKYGFFWNEDGDLYRDRGVTEIQMRYVPFINGNNAPFGSYARKINVEVYKHDEDRDLFTLPSWLWKPLNGMRVRLEWNYKANENGDILRKRPFIVWITKGGINYCWGFRMLCFCVSVTFRQWLDALKNPLSIPYNSKQLQESINQSKWDNPEWWRIWNAKLAKFFLFTLSKK